MNTFCLSTTSWHITDSEGNTSTEYNYMVAEFIWLNIFFGAVFGSYSSVSTSFTSLLYKMTLFVNLCTCLLTHSSEFVDRK